MMNRWQVSVVFDFPDLENSRCWIQYFLPKVAVVLKDKKFPNIFNKGISLKYTLPSFKNLFFVKIINYLRPRK